MKPPDPSEHPTIALRRMHRWRMALSGLVILIAGITLGAAGTIMILHSTRQTPAVPSEPEIQTEWTLRAMAPALNLTPEQFGSIGEILRERFEALAELRRSAWPAIQEQYEGMKSDILAVLTQEQADQWEAMSRRVDRLFDHGFPPEGRGMRGGRRGGTVDGRGGFRGGPDRAEFGSGMRPDSNDPRRMGGGFMGFDPNDMRRSPDGRGDPNAFSRRMMDFRGGRGGPDRAVGRNGDMEVMPAEPNTPSRMPTGNDTPIEPNSMP